MSEPDSGGGRIRATVEVCAEGLASAFEAAAGGADRVELCENLAVGGVTPGAGAVALASRELATPVHVLVRPRGGGFVYSGVEFEAMRHDVATARSLGASGVVVGLLTPEGRVDAGRTRTLVEAARPMAVTFHKAIDAARDPTEALDDLIALGVDRVLTSGGAATALEGLPTLAALARRAAGRIEVMAGGSIRPGEIPAILAAGVRSIHVGSAACLGGVVNAGAVRRVLEAAAMEEILHITTRAEWDRAEVEGAYRAGSLATEGFIHASTPRQVAGSANRFFRGQSGLVVLRIDPGRVRSPIVPGASPHSDEPFPHIHGPLNLDAVVEVVPLDPGEGGVFAWPPPEC